MANMNSLFRKGYLLAGVIMAANMFVVNEMKAMEEKENNTNNIQEDNKETEKIDIKSFLRIDKCKYIGFLLQWENTITLVGGALFTFANGLYNFYENKPSFYFDWLFAGWNSNPFAKGYLQFCPNINLGRGIFWLVMYYAQTLLKPDYCDKITRILEKKNMKEKEAKIFAIMYYSLLFGEYTPFAIVSKLVENIKSDNEKEYKNYEFIQILLRLLQNFVSVPLIIHLTSKFTISIAFDSIIWMVVSHFVIGDKFEKRVKNMDEVIIKLFPYVKKN